MKILVIGGGNMGLTYAKSIAQNSVDASISILEKESSKIIDLKTKTKFNIYDNAKNCVSSAEVILLAIKPQVAKLVFEEIITMVNTNQLVISIMAGVTLNTILNGLQIPKIVRAMPNLPSQVGHGVTGYFCAEKISKIDLKIVDQILGATGKIIETKTEDQIDAITALSGSGPAYVFYMMNAMMEQAEIFGFSPDEAKCIVLNTFSGTSQLFESSSVDAKTWIDRVTSKGGTTHAALTSFESNQVQSKIKEGVVAAYNRAKELSKN
mgnify:CR=1 FL=1